MSFTIKSNSSLKYPQSAVGNIHNYYGAPDYRAMLDFKNEVYKVDGVSKKIDEVIDVVRTSRGSYTSKMGELEFATANTPRLSLIAEKSEYGLYIGDAFKNFLSSGTTGSSFTATNAKDDICLSWEGAGSVDIVTSNTITFRNQINTNGRTYRFYARTTQVSGTISVNGDVSNIMIVNSNTAPMYIPYGETQERDYVTLPPAILNLLSSGSGTILCRFVFNADNRFARIFSMGALNENASAGGLLVQANHNYGSLGTGEVLLYPDAAARNSGVQQARNLGNRSEVNIVGLTFDDFGARAGVISHGQASIGKASDTGTVPPTAITRVDLGREPSGMVSTANILNGIITHCVIYDRILTEKEATIAAFFGN